MITARDVVDADAVAIKSCIDVVVDRPVELIDELIPHADTGVDQDRPGGVYHEVAEHREGRPRPRQMRCRRDVGEMEASDVDHIGTERAIIRPRLAPIAPVRERRSYRPRQCPRSRRFAGVVT